MKSFIRARALWAALIGVVTTRSAGTTRLAAIGSPLLIACAILAAGLVGLAVGRSNSPLPGWLSTILPTAATPGPPEPAPEAKAPEVMAAKSGGTHRIKYYRNPMGLPDKSDTPKKDNMGMAYLPVYEDEDDQDDDS